MTYARGLLLKEMNEIVVTVLKVKSLKFFFPESAGLGTRCPYWQPPVNVPIFRIQTCKINVSWEDCVRK